LGADGGEKLGVNRAAKLNLEDVSQKKKLNLEDEIVLGSPVNFVWRMIFRGHHCG
jgi:hypothetical protein